MLKEFRGKEEKVAGRCCKTGGGNWTAANWPWSEC